MLGSKEARLKFLTSRQISAEIDQMIKEAKNFLILISPFVRVPEDFVGRLREALSRNVNVLLVFGKENLKELEKAKLSKLDKLTLMYLENLHAKCSLNEKSAVVGSMNLHEGSERNREMAIAIPRGHNLYQEIAEEANSIIQDAERFALRERPVMRITRSFAGTKEGTCIRCQGSIAFSPERPFCRQCYAEWSLFFNYTYPEKFCHRCRKKAQTSMSRPLCIDCYKSTH